MQSVKAVGASIGSKVGKVTITMKYEDDVVICAAGLTLSPDLLR